MHTKKDAGNFEAARWAYALEPPRDAPSMEDMGTWGAHKLLLDAFWKE